MTIEEIDKEIADTIIIIKTDKYDRATRDFALSMVQALATLRISYIQQETDRIYLSQDLMNQ